MYRFNWWVNLVAKKSVLHPDRNGWITMGLISSWHRPWTPSIVWPPECRFFLEHAEQWDICLSACTNAKVPVSVVQVPWSVFLPCGWCIRQLLSCPCSDWLLFGSGSLATLELLIEPRWVLTHLCATFSLGLTICRSVWHHWKPHPNTFWMRWWRLLYLEMVALSDFPLLDVSSLTTIPFLSWMCLLDALCSRTYLYLLFCKSWISCAWKSRISYAPKMKRGSPHRWSMRL